MINDAGKELTEHGAKISTADKTEIETAITALKEAAAGEDAEVITGKLNALAQARMKIGQAIYGSAGPAGSAPGGDGKSAGANAGGASGDEKVVDADFEEVKDDKKKSA